MYLKHLKSTSYFLHTLAIAYASISTISHSISGLPTAKESPLPTTKPLQPIRIPSSKGVRPNLNPSGRTSMSRSTYPVTSTNPDISATAPAVP